MVDHLAVREKGRAALLAGELATEVPPAEPHDRWGVSMLLRPDPAMLGVLSAFAAQAAALAGPGHWVHGPSLLHVSLRALQPYRESPTIDGYADALDAAVAGVPRIRASVRTVNPHPHGIGVHVHPDGDGLDRLYARLDEALGERGLGGFEYWTRDMWYVHVVHFAGPVNVGALVRWCDERRDMVFGETTLNAAELVRYRYTGSGMRAETLHLAPLG